MREGRGGGGGGGGGSGEVERQCGADHPVLVMAMETELVMRLACAWLCRLSPPSVGHTTTN